MVRPVAAVILGYLGMAVWVMLSVGIAWRFLGQDFALDAQTNRATAAWLALNLPLSFIGAMLGGWLTASIAKVKAVPAVRALALLVLVLGLMMAVSETMRDPTGTISESDAQEAPAMIGSQQPTWYTFVIPFVGFAGVMLGGSIRSRAAAG
jgi:hypothetical protein